MLDEVLALEPELAEAWHERGILRLSSGDIAGARADLGRDLDLSPRGRFAAAARVTLEILRR